jgi:hypothetical protein
LHGIHKSPHFFLHRECIQRVSHSRVHGGQLIAQGALQTCEHINSRSHFCPHAICNCPIWQSPHFPVHLCSQESILSHDSGQENRFNSYVDEIIRHGTSTV